MGNDLFARIADGVVYRGLEVPHLFHVARDELYELDAEGLQFLDECDGTRRASAIGPAAVLAYADREGLVAYSETPCPRKLSRGASPVPSWRYLELVLTRRCNLACAHCYLGEARREDLPLELVARVLDEFDALQGLRVLLSGGEPLLYPDWHRIAELVSGRGFRSVLLTNGQLVTRELLRGFGGHEVQVSLDGLEPGHDALRGSGTFRRAVRAAELTREAGLDLSVATMVHAGNVGELEGLEEMVRSLGAREWGLDLPVSAGRWLHAGGAMAAEISDAARALARAFGGSCHGSGEGFACGAHLGAVLPPGEVCRCGLYADTVLGRAGAGLLKAWERKRPQALAAIGVCRECGSAGDCGGGCRFRAEAADAGGADPVMCAAYGRLAGLGPGPGPGPEEG